MASNDRDSGTGVRQDDAGPEGRAAADELVSQLYRDLRRLAKWQMGRGPPGVTLQPTALVHEAYLRLADRSRVEWTSRTHFIAVASKVMRNLLIDHARAKSADKRGGGWRAVTLVDEAVGCHELDMERMLDLDRALQRLAEHDDRQARVVELRYFGGMTMAEVAGTLGVSQRTAEGLWTHARAWLLRELSRGGGA